MQVDGVFSGDCGVSFWHLARRKASSKEKKGSKLSRFHILLVNQQSCSFFKIGLRF